MPLESATYLDTLEPDWPDGASDKVSIGDDNLRMIKKVLQNTFPAINAPVSGTPTQINNITLNTPWQDNSATAGALSNFNLTDPSKTDGSLAALAVATPTIPQANANTNLAMSIALFLQIQYPVGGEFRSYTDNRNPVDILGFGVWEAVVGLIAGVGAATDSQGYTQNYSAGYQAGWWRVQGKHIVSQALDITLKMNPIDDHEHEIPMLNKGPGGSSVCQGYGDTQINAKTLAAGGHTPTGSASATIGAGGVADGSAFYNPYYGCYIWKRTA